MKNNRLSLTVISCIMCPAVMFSGGPWRIVTESAGNDSTYRYIERGLLTSVSSYRNRELRTPGSDAAGNCREIHTTSPGQLGGLLGEDVHTVDSLVIEGPVDGTDIRVMWEASLKGSLKVINLEKAVVEDGRIPERAFWHLEEQLEPGGEYIDCIKLRRIILPDGVREIGERAFSYAINLEHINLPPTLMTIGEAAFSDCISLREDPLVFPEGIEKISDLLFLNCSDLKGAVVLPPTVREIGAGAFFQSKISSINFPEGLNTIGDAAFYASGLREVRLPESCLNIEGSSTFQLNYELETIRLPEGLESIPGSFASTCLKLHDINIPQTVKTIKDYALWQCRSLKRLELPQELETIETVGLWYLDSLERIKFPPTLKRIGAESCSYWAGIKEIYCAAADPPLCEESKVNPGNTPFGSYGSTFYMRTPQETPVYVPVGASDKYRAAWGWSYFTNFIETDFSGMEGASCEKEDGIKTVYDLTGRKETSPAPNQIYIQNGKKIMHRP